MKEQKLISIIVPVYNIQDYLKECLNSLLEQTYRNIEIILIDDGSTDDSGTICDHYKNKNSSIRVIHQKNAGLSAARNRGIKASRGDMICFVDSDDSINKRYVEDLWRALTGTNSDISVCGYNEIIPKKETITTKEALKRILTEQENIDILAWNKMYKKCLFLDNSISYPVGQIHEDNLTTYKLYSKANKISYIDKSLYNYRIRQGSITFKEKKLTNLRIREQAALEAIEYLNEDEEKEYAKISLLLAKLAYIDNAIAKRIDIAEFNKARNWILRNKRQLKSYALSSKVKLYLTLLSTPRGCLYILMRKIIHD